ncbi:hypothetical protein I302_107505 [Kwoniella bestiolae CBS 10118]|uniref:Beta-lactamase-related domain-containing protein n=1 Tax=Kwoniella bestiolae CBS 10118 TaxID=1296100 RepID=A0A1B9FYD9_9TREE|nr:hypothetical protein I302_06754 [Kwoniella bestiolae CBS 10118]OCF23770.1 hypothetical protein I302_06754 [Kwoniella bestiolae CBS 10118]
MSLIFASVDHRISRIPLGRDFDRDLKTEKPLAEVDDDFQAAQLSSVVGTFKDLAGGLEVDKPDFDPCHKPSSAMTKCKTLITVSSKDWLQLVQKKYDIPGLAVAIVASPSSDAKTDNETADHNWQSEVLTFGSRNLNGDALTADSLFLIASNTKLFLAVSIGMLIDRDTILKTGQKLEWTSKMIDVLPGWGLVEKVAEKEATIEDLLTMRTGVGFHPYVPFFTDPSKQLDMMSHLPPFSKFRSKWQYNNYNYLILAHMVSLVSGQHFSHFMYDNILKPLGMTSALFDVLAAEKTGIRTDAIVRVGKHMEVVYTDSEGDHKMRGEKKNVGFWTKGTGEGIWGPGGLIMSSNDVVRWLRELLSPTIISPHILDKCAKPQISAGGLVLTETENLSYGLALWTSSYRGHKLIFHYGKQLGQHSLFVRLPESGIAVAVMNLGDEIGSTLNKTILYTILDDVLGLETGRWEEELLIKWISDQEKDEVESTDKDGESQDETVDVGLHVEGVYHHPAWGNLEFRQFPDNDVDYSIKRLLREQTRLPCPSFIAALPVREDSYLLLHGAKGRFTWTGIQLYDEHAPTRITRDSIVRVSGSGHAIVNTEGMGMFDGFWTYDKATFKHHVVGSDPKSGAEVWFDRVA